MNDPFIPSEIEQLPLVDQFLTCCSCRESFSFPVISSDTFNLISYKDAGKKFLPRKCPECRRLEREERRRKHQELMVQGKQIPNHNDNFIGPPKDKSMVEKAKQMVYSKRAYLGYREK